MVDLVLQSFALHGTMPSALGSVHARAEPLEPAGPLWKKVKSEVSETFKLDSHSHAFSAGIPETPETCKSEEPIKEETWEEGQDEGVKSEAVQGANSNNYLWDDQDWDWHVDQPEDAPGLDCKAECYTSDHPHSVPVDVHDDQAYEKIEMRHFEDADALLELLRSGRLSQVAQSMRCKIGIDLTAYQDPKTAVRDFLERYSNRQVKVTYQHKRNAAGIVAKLVTPQFFERAFEGSMAADEKGAEVSACKAFLKDPQVQQVSKLVPPSISLIRKRLQFNKYQKNSITEHGLCPRELQTEMVQEVYMTFRDMGCRTALWDENL